MVLRYNDGEDRQLCVNWHRPLLSFVVVHAGPVTLRFLGRDLTVQKACGGILDSSFSELCEQV